MVKVSTLYQTKQLWQVSSQKAYLMVILFLSCQMEIDGKELESKDENTENLC